MDALKWYTEYELSFVVVGVQLMQLKPKQALVQIKGLLPIQCQAFICSNAGILFGTNISVILIKIHSISVKKMELEMPSMNWQPFVCLNVLRLVWELAEDELRIQQYGMCQFQYLGYIYASRIFLFCIFCCFDI